MSCAIRSMRTQQNGLSLLGRMTASLGKNRQRPPQRICASGQSAQAVTLLYGARNEIHNNAVALKDWLERKE